MKPGRISSDRKSLYGRTRRFLKSELLSHREFILLRGFVSNFGSMAIFGGLLRDLALGHSEKFSSDIDIVVKGVPKDILQRRLAMFGATTNAFGGCRLSVGRWMLDVWPLEETWALKKQNFDCQLLEYRDLLGSTFFNWDCALYDLESGDLMHSLMYFDEINSGYLDINFRQNPNELGAAVKAFRLMASNRVTLSPDLAAFLLGIINSAGIHEIVSKDQQSSSRTRLEREFLGSIAIALRKHGEACPTSNFEFHDFQKELPMHRA